MSNHLEHESSPYLQQHAQNPIHWYPWGEEALAKAKEEHKSIFLSIGHSSSYWCHLMQKESFQNREIAELLNERFIAIKVDKEERPDIDKYHQTIYRLMTRSLGNSPISIFMTENLEPFYAASYIAPEAIEEQLGFEELLRVISNKYITDYDTLVEKGLEVLSYINPKDEKIEATRLNLNITKTISIHTDNLLDKKYGGFGSSPKFPNASTLMLLFETYNMRDDDKLLDAALLTLNNMAKGGFYDHIDGGFFRYATDEQWLIPNFEKTTYDNAQLITLYLHAFQLTGDLYYHNIAFRTIEFMLTKMSNKRLFYSTSDSETDGYFTYNYEEVVEKLKEHHYSLLEITKICTTLNITKEGDFNGQSMLTLDDPNTLTESYYPHVIALLKEIRNKRTYPHIDKKIITSWNAMMISTLFVAGRTEELYQTIAIESLDELLKTLYVNKRLYHTKIDKNIPKIGGFLEDYAYLGETLIHAYQATLNRDYLTIATEITNSMIEQFYEHGKWKFSRGEFETIEEIYDTSYPSSLSTALSLLLHISSLVDTTYRKFIFRTLEVNSYKLMRQPLSSPKLTEVMLRYLKDDIITLSNQEQR